MTRLVPRPWRRPRGGVFARYLKFVQLRREGFACGQPSHAIDKFVVHDTDFDSPVVDLRQEAPRHTGLGCRDRRIEPTPGTKMPLNCLELSGYFGGN
jgi:hypothetical protein